MSVALVDVPEGVHVELPQDCTAASNPGAADALLVFVRDRVGLDGAGEPAIAAGRRSSGSATSRSGRLRLRKGGLSGSVLSVPHALPSSCPLTDFDLAARLALLLVVQTRRRRWPTPGRSHSGRQRTRRVLPSALSKSWARGI
jgi:hypothetical protein